VWFYRDGFPHQLVAGIGFKVETEGNRAYVLREIIGIEVPAFFYFGCENYLSGLPYFRRRRL
jgi:hypothetical protein